MLRWNWVRDSPVTDARSERLARPRRGRFARVVAVAASAGMVGCVLVVAAGGAAWFRVEFLAPGRGSSAHCPVPCWEQSGGLEGWAGCA